MNKNENEDMMLEAGRENDHKKKQKKIPDKIEIFSINDLT